MSAGAAIDPTYKIGQEAARRSRLRQCRPARLAPWARNNARHPEQIQPKASLPLQQAGIQMASSHRERLLPAQGLPQDRNSLRQAGKKLSRFRLPHSCYHMVDLISLGPRTKGVEGNPALSCSAKAEHPVFRQISAITGSSASADDDNPAPTSPRCRLSSSRRSSARGRPRACASRRRAHSPRASCFACRTMRSRRAR